MDDDRDSVPFSSKKCRPQLPHQLFHNKFKSNMNAITDRDPDWAKVSLRRKNSERDSSNGSDTSGGCSIGSNSFAFNFDAVHMSTDEAMMSSEQRQAADEQAANVAVASLKSIATSYTKEVQSESSQRNACAYHWMPTTKLETHTSFLSQIG